jgi:membrane protein insertase Oxa1/YidC/SpoIIIJ
VLALLTGVTQWIVQKMMTPATTDPQQQQMQAMMQFMPLMFIFFSLSVPAGLVLYWVTSNVFSMIQQYFITGWGSLRPAAAAAGAGGAAVAKRQEAKVPPPGPALVAPPEANGHSRQAGAVERSIPQAPTAARKRRRRSGK